MRAASAAGTPCAARPSCSASGRRRGQPDDHQREEDADREHAGRVHEGREHAGARAALGAAAALFITPALLGDENRPMPMPVQEQDARRTSRRRSHRQQDQQQEAERGEQHPAGRERPRAEAVREAARRRAGDQEADDQRQHVDAGPQRRLREVVAVLRQPDPLQPDDQDELQAAAAHRRQQRGEVARRERRGCGTARGGTSARRRAAR